jgi:hypothetical protein
MFDSLYRIQPLEGTLILLDAKTMEPFLLIEMEPYGRERPALRDYHEIEDRLKSFGMDADEYLATAEQAEGQCGIKYIFLDA